MGERIVVVSDSTAYLPPEVQARLKVPTIPLRLLWGDEVLRDGVDVQPQAFYERLEVDPVMPTTSQPSAGEFVDFFRRVAEQTNADILLGIFISSRLSGTVSSAELAKGMLPEMRVEVVDSLSTSMGLGLQVMAAAEAVLGGAPLKEALEVIERVRYRLQTLFVVDTLEFLHRGGRIGGAARFLGTALKLKPLLELEEGKIESLEKVRTKRKALDRLLEVALERRGQGAVPRAAVIHANAREECLAFEQEVQACLEPQELYVSELSPVIGAHTGPGTLGLTFYTM